MPRRLVVFCDHQGVVRLNSLGACPSLARIALFMAQAGSFWGCALTWLLLSAFEPRLFQPLVLSGVLGFCIFKSIKHLLRRPRPFISHAQHVVLRSTPPDVFSFPSGHALHAACVATIVSLAWPWAWALGVAWYLVMAASRVVLGLHYPTDVLLGGVLGVVLGWACWLVV